MLRQNLPNAKEEGRGDKGEVLLAVAVFPPGAKKREGGKRDEEPKGNRVGNWAVRWASNRGAQTNSVLITFYINLSL